ncbi:hypothetical protein LOTGIDRAFT_115152 [Lottia gigantea]|uniref:OTU domain-containing protein n=1 Tax=Lottia gigantea TaxID=225164 RepID=V4C730_LOTGI|nr:hypothetical protein LOTGIDRAFT_115152 [Lottia gigantea]ESO97479.1 hypothetical protein LOTGIDRAFT_115152 [Lottia gigantea]
MCIFIIEKMNIGDAVDLIQYSESEWKGDTQKAVVIKQAYKELPSITNCNNIRAIRGDNYCAIRGCVYQMLTCGSMDASKLPGMMCIIDTLHELYEDPSSGLSQWTFANRLKCTGENKLSTLCRCVLTLFSKLSTYKEREEMTLNLLNAHPDTDIEIMEGVKLLMLVKAVELFRDNQKGKDLPIFANLMFARDTSDSISKFVLNHLNPVGDSSGLEQVEMCLLGQTISTIIRVARLSHFGAEDFLCDFPSRENDWPSIYLLAEDDRHYNVPTP